MAREASPVWRIGIDLGGTKIEGVLLDPSGEQRARKRIAAPRGDYETTVRTIAGLVAELEGAAERVPVVGVGIPGSIQSNLVHGSNSTWVNGHPLPRDLSQRLGRSVSFANDADCFALSEATTGAGAGMRSVFGVILGTGCGGGLVYDGRLIKGRNGIAGEWGHNPLPWSSPAEHPGPACWCGRLGCMEVWVSGTAMSADHHRITGQEFAAMEIAERAKTGDPDAIATLKRHADRLARGLAHVINIFDPEVIVLGGGLSKLASLYEVLPALVARRVFAAAPLVDIRPPRWGDASGVLGAAWLGGQA